MAKKEHESPLHAALDDFGAAEKQLSVARLEHQEKILIALFGEEVMRDPRRCRSEAQRVERAIRAIIADIADPVDRRVAQAVFASEEEFYGEIVEQRKIWVNKNDKGFDDNQYRKRRPEVIKDVAAALPRALAVDGDVFDPTPSPRARRAAKLLFPYVQEALLCVEIYDACVLSADIHGVRDAFHKATHVVLASRNVSSDLGLWALAHCHKYLTALERERSGRDFLGEDLLSIKLMWPTRLKTVFRDSQVDEIELALLEAESDKPVPFVDQLLRKHTGEIIYDRWLGLLSVSELDPCGSQSNQFLPTRYDREQLNRHLLELCVRLQGLFPGDIWSAYEANTSKRIHAAVTTDAVLLECGVLGESDKGRTIKTALIEAMRERPASRLYDEAEKRRLAAKEGRST